MANIMKKQTQNILDIRKINIMRSPKKGGSSDIDAIPYLKELGIKLIENPQPIQFTPNINEHIHRWAPYVQGFSASFVQSVIDQYKKVYGEPIIFDPFAGCGTVLVQAKLNGYESYGVELNTLLQFIAETKLNSWDVSPEYLIKVYNSMPKDKKAHSPSFLKTNRHFRPGVLRNLEIIKGGIESLEEKSKKQIKAKNLLRLAFSSILIECSNLKRSPCLGYSKNKIVEDAAPFVLMTQKVHQIADDLKIIRAQYKDFIDVKSEVILANAMIYQHNKKFDLVITSPPYMNGMDYVINYKIEMSWLGFVNSYEELKKLKDEMVVCDNVSKRSIKQFYNSKSTYTNDWIESIKFNISKNIEKRGKYRRLDMPYIVHKYFDDMYRAIKNVVLSLNTGGRVILVVGDSLIADVYVPTDLLIARIGLDLGLKVEKIEKARERRSGQIRSYKLRESIITLVKE